MLFSASVQRSVPVVVCAGRRKVEITSVADSALTVVAIRLYAEALGRCI